MFKIIKVPGIYHFENVGKDGRRRMPTIRLIQSWKSWIWDQSLPENMRWEFGKPLKLWIFETKKLQNQETKTLWSQGTLKTRNQENKKQQNDNQETKNQETNKPTNRETSKPRSQETEKPANQETKKLRNQAALYLQHFNHISFLTVLDKSLMIARAENTAMIGKIRRPCQDVLRQTIFQADSIALRIHTKTRRRGRPKLSWAVQVLKFAMQTSGDGLSGAMVDENS